MNLLSWLLGHLSIVVTEKVYADYIQRDLNMEVRERLSINC